MTYRAPLPDIEASMRFAMASAISAASIDSGPSDSDRAFEDLGEGMAASILEQAAKYAEGVLDHDVTRLG
jgi:hypothetical protein